MSSLGDGSRLNDSLRRIKYRMIDNILKAALYQFNCDRSPQKTTDENNSPSSNQISPKNRIISSSQAAPDLFDEIPFHVPFRTPYAAPEDILHEAKLRYKPLPAIEDPLKEPHILNPLPPYPGFTTPVDPGILTYDKVSKNFGNFDSLCFPIRCVANHLTVPLTEAEFYDLQLGKEVRLQTNIHLQCYSDAKYLKLPGVTKLPSFVTTGTMCTARGVFHRAAMFYFCVVHNLVKLRQWNITYRDDKVILSSKFYEKSIVSNPYPKFDIRYLDHSYLTEMKYIHYCILVCQYYSTLAQQLIAFTELEPLIERNTFILRDSDQLVNTLEFPSMHIGAECEVASSSGTEMSDPPEDPCQSILEESPENAVSSSSEFLANRSVLQRHIIKPHSRLNKVDYPEHNFDSRTSSKQMPNNSVIDASSQTCRTETTNESIQVEEVGSSRRVNVDENDYAAALFLSSLKTMPMFAARPSKSAQEPPRRKRRKPTAVESHMQLRSTPKKNRQS